MQSARVELGKKVERVVKSAPLPQKIRDEYPNLEKRMVEKNHLDFRFEVIYEGQPALGTEMRKIKAGEIWGANTE